MITIQIVDKTQQIKSVLDNIGGNLVLSSDEIKAINSIEQVQPSIVMLNYDFCKEQTADYISLILGISPKSNVIILADDLSQEKVIDCLIAGAKGYQNFDRLDFYAKKLISVVDAGEAWVSRSLVAQLLDRLRVEYVKK